MDFPQIFAILFTCNFFGVKCHNATTKNVTNIGPRIVGGEECDRGEFPFAALVLNSISVCGGVLLSLNWALTAAHCIHRSLISRNLSRVLIGFHTLNPDQHQERFIIKGVPHGKFDRSKMNHAEKPELRYDIGLVQVREPFDRAPSIGFANLPSPGFAKNCEYATVFGVGSTEIQYPFGYTKKPERKLIKNRNITREESQPTPTHTFDNRLHCVDLHLTDRKTCSKTWETSIVDGTILCTMETVGGKDACQGDSGGPLICENVVIGLVSMGKGCGLADYSATFSNVESYLDFINETTKGENMKEKQMEKERGEYRSGDRGMEWGGGKSDVKNKTCAIGTVKSLVCLMLGGLVFKRYF